MRPVTLTFSPIEHVTLLSLAALAVAVMQNDEERGREHVTLLSQPGIDAVAKSLMEKLAAPLEPPATEPVVASTEG